MANGVAIFLNELTSCVESPVIDTNSSNGVASVIGIEPASVTFDSTVIESRRLMVDAAAWAKIQNYISRRFHSRKRQDKIKTETVGNLRKAKSLEPPPSNTCPKTPIQRDSAHGVSLKRACSVHERAGGTEHINSEFPDEFLICENTQHLPRYNEGILWESPNPNVLSAPTRLEASKSAMQDTPHIHFEAPPSPIPGITRPEGSRPLPGATLNNSAATLQSNLSFQSGAPVTSTSTSSSTYAVAITDQDAGPTSHACSPIPISTTTMIPGADNELPFTADYWIWDENARNYFHIEPDGTKSWHPTEDEFD